MRSCNWPGSDSEAPLQSCCIGVIFDTRVHTDFTISDGVARFTRPSHTTAWVDSVLLAQRCLETHDFRCTMSHDVFISYAWGHRKPLVHQVAKGLRAAGVSVWLDESNLSSADFVRDMMSAVRRTRFTVLFVSRTYCASKSCRVEAMCAYTHKDNSEVIVVNLEDGFDPAKDPAAEGEVAVFAQRNIWVDMRTADDDEALAGGLPQLLDQLRARGLSLGGKPAADTAGAPTASTSVVPTAGRASLSTYSRRGISVAGLRALIDAAGGSGALSGRSVIDVRSSILDAGARAGNAAYCDWPASAAHCGDATAYAMWVFDMPFLALVDSLDVFDQRVRAAGAKAASYFWIDFLSLPPSSQDFEAEWSVVALRELMRGIGCTLMHLEWTREPGPAALGSHWCAWEVLGAGTLGALHAVFAPAEERALEASLAANLHEATARAARFRFGLAAPRSLEERLLASAIGRAGGETEATRLVQRALNSALGAAAARAAQESHSAALKTTPFSSLQ